MKDPKFKPQADFVKKATFPSLARYKVMHRESIAQPDKFWGRLGKQELDWFTQPKKVLQWKEPFAKWFGGGKLNLSYNCLDRHCQSSAEQSCDYL